MIEEFVLGMSFSDKLMSQICDDQWNQFSDIKFWKILYDQAIESFKKVKEEGSQIPFGDGNGNKRIFNYIALLH